MEKVFRGDGELSPSISVSQNPLSAPVVVTSAVEADKVNEKLISNLLPVLELPKLVYSSPTPLREKSDLQKLSTAKSHPLFLLRSERLFTFSNLREEESVFRGVIQHKQIESEEFKTWFGSDKHNWAVELLNLHRKAFAYDRYLRFDGKGQRFFFTHKEQPKTIRWSIGGKQASREVTTPHTATRIDSEGIKERLPFGWRHQGVRSNFVHLPIGLFLRIEPTWLLTKDGKVPRAALVLVQFFRTG